MIKSGTLFSMELEYEDIPSLQRAVKKLGFDINSNEEWKESGCSTPIVYASMFKNGTEATEMEFFVGFKQYGNLYSQTSICNLEQYIEFRNHQGLTGNELFDVIIKEQINEFVWDMALADTDEFCQCS